MLQIVFGWILKSCRSSSSKTYKNWERFCKKTCLKDIKLPVKIRDIDKFIKHNFITISVLVIKIRKNTQSMYKKTVSKKKHYEEKKAKSTVLIENFNAFM